MRNFDYSACKDRKWDTKTVNYLGLIHESRGKQSFYLKMNEKMLRRMEEFAKISSTEASNAIEGITAPKSRIKKLLTKTVKPQNFSEQQILGYKDALDEIESMSFSLPVTPKLILHLHSVLFAHTGSSCSGKFKTVPNCISAKDEDGKQFILFTPLSPFETPEAMQQLCDGYNIAIGEGKVDPLLLIPAFIHDFLCIHPFVDGNGRMSRLLTTLLLYRNGYFVGRYISLEAKIAGNKDFYYDALLRSQCGWHEGKDDPVPFIKYLLAIIIGAYRDFEERVELVDEKLPAIDMVRNAVCLKIGKFKKADILELCPTLSAASVERSLKALCQSKEISKHQSGKATYYLREML